MRCSANVFFIFQTLVRGDCLSRDAIERWWHSVSHELIHSVRVWHNAPTMHTHIHISNETQIKKLVTHTLNTSILLWFCFALQSFHRKMKLEMVESSLQRHRCGISFSNLFGPEIFPCSMFKWLKYSSFFTCVACLLLVSILFRIRSIKKCFSWFVGLFVASNGFCLTIYNHWTITCEFSWRKQQ